MEDKHGSQRFQQFALAIVGPGGTGKTAVLKSVEALTNFFAGTDTVRKMAPSNAAARLLQGDTIHSLCKLPFGAATLMSKTGRLTKERLKGHRKKWSPVIAAYIDEVSMISADQFCQINVRLCQAKMRAYEEDFGGLGACEDHQQGPCLQPHRQ